jgi:hypothetical protein
MRIITGALAFFESSARNLAAEAAAGVLADDHDLVRRDAGPARDGRDRLHRALRRAVQMELAVLPVGHRRARFERLMSGRLGHERLIEDEVGFLEPLFDVAEDPFVGRLAHRHLAGGRVGEVFVGPFPVDDLGRSRGSSTGAASAPAGRWRRGCGRRSCTGRRAGRLRRRRRRAGGGATLFAGGSGRCRCLRSGCAGAGGGVRRTAPTRCGRRRRGAHPGVALRACVRTARPQTFNGIDDEGQRLELDVDRFDRERGGELVDGSDGENRLAVVERLVRQAALGLRRGLHAFAECAACSGARHVVGGENRLDALHGQRSARIEPRHARVRHRAAEQLREQHALDAIVLGILRLAGDLGDEVGGREVLADQFVSHIRHSSCVLRPASAK